MSGIYCILNKKNERRYVGSAKNIKQRWSTHRHMLMSNKHHSITLQRAFNKYGKDNFEFIILEVVENVSLLIEREQYYIDLFQSCDSLKGYNICKIAGSCLGRKLSPEHIEQIRKWSTGRKHTLESKKKMSLASAGHEVPEEMRHKLHEALRGEKSYKAGITDEQAGQIKILLMKNIIKLKEIAIMFSVSEKTVSLIKTGKRWTHVMPELNEKLVLIKSGSGTRARSAILTEQQVIEIKKLLVEKQTCTAISKIFKVSISTINRIKLGQTWKNVATQ